MDSLIDIVSFIKNRYSQSLIELPCFDLQTKKSELLLQPKFLYRGENNSYPKTKSNWNRYYEEYPQLKREINYFLTGLDLDFAVTTNEFSLYHFLRESLFNISVVEPESDDWNIYLSVAGLMQHYGFDTSLIDLTSDINIAAHFACSNGTIGNVGQLMVIETDKIQNRYFDLTQTIGKRPKVQKSFVMAVPLGSDLKSRDFINEFGADWLLFKITENDKEQFSNPSLLSIEDDTIPKEIIDWYESHIVPCAGISGAVKSYFESKIEKLLL